VLSAFHGGFVAEQFAGIGHVLSPLLSIHDFNLPGGLTSTNRRSLSFVSRILVDHQIALVQQVQQQLPSIWLLQRRAQQRGG